MGKSVLLLNDELDADKVSAVHAACTRIGASISEARSSDGLPEDPTYDLCIAGLGRGERQVSGDICEMLSGQEKVFPLLLLCDEPLVRSHVSLQDARVNLLSSPLTEEMLVSSLHSLMDGVAWVASDEPSPGPETPMSEAWGHHYWTCRIAQQIDDSDLIFDKRKNGVLACICDQDPMGAGATLLAPMESLFLDRESGVEEAMKAVGGAGALASLNTQTERWVFDISKEDAKVFLCSPQRVPQVHEITENRVMWAAPGDLVLIVRDGEAVCDDETFDLAIRAGGQVMARKLRKEGDRVGENFACLCIEVVG